MNDRKISRRTALTLTAAAATGAAILAEAKPALATWPTITSPADVIAATAAASSATDAMKKRLKAPVKFQGHDICSWEDVETILIVTAAAISNNKDWLWNVNCKTHGSRH